MSEAVSLRPASIRPALLLRLALRLLWRDWRGGELRLLLLSLIMAVTSVTGIALFTDRLQQALVQESATMLAADRVLSGREPAPGEWMVEARSRGLRTASFVAFTSMAFSDDGNLLVAAKAVSDEYPLRGSLEVAEQPFVEGAPVEAGPPRGEVWAESRLLSALQVDIGDPVYVGEATFTVTRVLTHEPDRQQGGMLENAGPRLLFHRDDLDATGVIQPGSRASYRYLFAGDAAVLESFGEWLSERSAGEYRLRDIREESQEVDEALQRGQSFLLLGSLFAVVLAGVAIALTARRYSERHFDYVAIMKTLGSTSRQIMSLYLVILLLLLVAAVTLGSLAGYLVHESILWLLTAILPVTLPPGSMLPYLMGAMTALICLLAFALPPLLALRDAAPLRVLRKDIDSGLKGSLLPYWAGGLGAMTLLLWYSRDIMLTLMLVLVVAGIVALVSALAWLVLRSTRVAGSRAGSPWGLAFSSARRRRHQTVLQMLVFSITLMALLSLTVLRTDLLDDWQAQLPEDAPNHFMMNITENQVAGMTDYFRDNGVRPRPFYPMVSAGLLTINGDSARQLWGAGESRGNLTESTAENDEEGENRDSDRRIANRQITWTADLPPDNEVVSGEWWGESPEPGLVSVEDDYAERLGMETGDELHFESGGQEFSATVHNLRSVQWDNMQPNFFFIFSPGTLDGSGATYLSTVQLEGEDKQLLNPLLRQFSTVVVLEIDALIEQVRTIIDQVSAAVELIAVLVLAAGALVLLACVNATLDERFRENAVLRALGARQRLIMSSLVIEFAFIGLVAGSIAVLGTEGVLYYLQTEMFGQAFRPHYWAWFAGPVSGTLLIGALGAAATRRVVHTSPLIVLREMA
ncbi:MAG: FtsX-like permease family protein [Pseudohongiellaceae bacterium]